MPYSFGKSKFIMIEYIHYLSRFIIFLPLVSVRDTPILYFYPGAGTWHSDPLYVSERDTPIPYMCRNVTLRSPICVGT